MARHRWADLMIRAAENWDGLEWRLLTTGNEWSEWVALTDLAPLWGHNDQYELRPIRRPLFQQRVEVPKAETEAPITGTQFFFPRPDSKDFVGSTWWYGFEADLERLKRGLVYLTAEDAAARGRAMVETEE